MDSKFYGKLWVATCTDLQDVILREKVTRLQPQKTDSRKAHATFASIYVRYVSIVNALGDIYDQTLQVQKRGVVKVILTLATKRMLELQLDLKKIEMSEYMYFDQTLIEQKLIPTDVQLLTPFYYPMQRSDDIQGLLNGVRQFGESEEDSVQEPAKKTVKHLIEASKIISPEEQRKLDERKALVYAINVVISHEKARQSRNLHYNIKVHPKFYAKMLIPEVEAGPEYHFTFKEDQMPLFPVKRTDFGTNFYKVKRCFDDDSEFGGLSENKAKEENVKLFSTEIGTFTALDFVARLLRDINRNEAAVAIQRCYLKFQLRRAIKAKKLQHQHDLGMLELSRIDHTEEYEKMKEMREERRSKKKAFDRAFIQACEDDKARILRLRTPYIVEDITDHIRSWFREMYNAAGEFDTYPPEVKGGSILILRGETKTPSEFANFIAKRKKMTPEQIKKENEKEKKQKAAEKKKKKIEKQKAKKALKAQKAAWAKQTNQWAFDDGRFITDAVLSLESAFDKYVKEWQFVDEFENLAELPYMDWITENNYADVHQALRLEVDKLLRVELELLRKALCEDQKVKYKAPKGKKDKKSKKGKKKKSGMHMKMEELEEMYDEFLSNNIIIPCPQVNMDDFIGDLNYGAHDQRNDDLTPPHNLEEVKHLLRQWTFGLGDINVPKFRSICIVGPPGCGKKLLAFGLIRELGAVLFNISPDVVVQFEDDIKTFVNNLTKLSKILAPSVLLINNAHMPFIKRVTPDIEDQNPKLLSKYLPKLKQKIKVNEKVIIIGTSNQPFAANLGKFKKTFEKFAVCYGPDYGSTFLAWKKVLPPMGVDPEFDYSALAKVTKFFQMNQILSVPEKVLSLERRAHLQQRPLQPAELLKSLVFDDFPDHPMTEKDLAKFVDFNKKLNKFKKKQSHKRRNRSL